MSVLYSDLIDYPVNEDNNIVKITSDGQSTVLYFEPSSDPFENELNLKHIISSGTLRVFNVDHISFVPFPKPSRDQHKWILMAGADDESKPINKLSIYSVFYGDLLIAQRCEGKICPIPKQDLALIPDFLAPDKDLRDDLRHNADKSHHIPDEHEL